MVLPPLHIKTPYTKNSLIAFTASTSSAPSAWIVILSPPEKYNAIIPIILFTLTHLLSNSISILLSNLHAI